METHCYCYRNSSGWSHWESATIEGNIHTTWNVAACFGVWPFYHCLLEQLKYNLISLVSLSSTSHALSSLCTSMDDPEIIVSLHADIEGDCYSLYTRRLSFNCGTCIGPSYWLPYSRLWYWSQFYTIPYSRLWYWSQFLIMVDTTFECFMFECLCLLLRGWSLPLINFTLAGIHYMGSTCDVDWIPMRVMII